MRHSFIFIEWKKTKETPETGIHIFLPHICGTLADTDALIYFVNGKQSGRANSGAATGMQLHTPVQPSCLSAWHIWHAELLSLHILQSSSELSGCGRCLLLPKAASQGLLCEVSVEPKGSWRDAHTEPRCSKWEEYLLIYSFGTCWLYLHVPTLETELAIIEKSNHTSITKCDKPHFWKDALRHPDVRGRCNVASLSSSSKGPVGNLKHLMVKQHKLNHVHRNDNPCLISYPVIMSL